MLLLNQSSILIYYTEHASNIVRSLQQRTRLIIDNPIIDDGYIFPLSNAIYWHQIRDSRRWKGDFYC